jgi:hypothetical protein
VRRSIKLAGMAVTCVAVGSLVTGLAVASTTTSAVTLCVAKSNAVTYSASATCAKGQTAYPVASASDVAALAGRMDAAEANRAADANTIQNLSDRLATDETTITNLASQLNALHAIDAGTLTAQLRNPSAFGFGVDITGSKLAAGAAVIAHYLDSGTPTQVGAGTANVDGTLDGGLGFVCPADSNVYLTSTDWFGATVTSNIIAGC